MFKYILFDMDGTLLHFDHQEFGRQYCALLGEKLAELVPPRQLVAQLWASTEVMVKNLDGSRWNEEVFWTDFTDKLQVPALQLKPLLDEFYHRDFGRLQNIVRQDDNARKVLQAAMAGGCGLVLATNPIFPQTAVLQRLAWAGVGDIPFTHITSYENSHFCKPQLEYYREILAIIGCQPEECLMIGNDVEEDMIAGKLGLKTYLLTDNLINRKNLIPQADYISTLAELADNMEALLKGELL